MIALIWAKAGWNTRSKSLGHCNQMASCGSHSAGTRFAEPVSITLLAMLTAIVSNNAGNANLKIAVNDLSGITFPRDDKGLVVEPDTVVLVQHVSRGLEVLAR